MNGYCNIHQTPMLMRRMNGGWTTVCPWCDALGKYNRRTGFEKEFNGYTRPEDMDSKDNTEE